VYRDIDSGRRPRIPPHVHNRQPVHVTPPFLFQDPPVAASYCAMTLAGTGPRLRTATPWSFAQARIPLLRSRVAAVRLGASAVLCGYGQCFSASSPARAAVMPAAARIRTLIHAATALRRSHTRALSLLSQARTFPGQVKAFGSQQRTTPGKPGACPA